MRKSILPLFAALLAAFSITAHAGVALQPFETNSLARIIEQNKGKPFVLILWSLDCEYCQASLKTLAQEKRKRPNLKIVTLATDAMTDPQTAKLIRKRLNSLGMHANAWAFGAAPAEQLRHALDPGWHGEMPRSYWFNASGEKLAYSGVLDTALIDKYASR